MVPKTILILNTKTTLGETPQGKRGRPDIPEQKKPHRRKTQQDEVKRNSKNKSKPGTSNVPSTAASTVPVLSTSAAPTADVASTSEGQILTHLAAINALVKSTMNAAGERMGRIEQTCNAILKNQASG